MVYLHIVSRVIIYNDTDTNIVNTLSVYYSMVYYSMVYDIAIVILQDN